MFLEQEQVWTSKSPDETMEIGSALGRLLQPPEVVLLTGDLGMGKTVLVRGVVRGLGVHDSEPISSPTFALLNSYQGRCPVHHVDLYRLDSLDQFNSMGLFELLQGDTVTLIEWGERVRPWIPRGYEVRINDMGDDCRRIQCRYFSVYDDNSS